jgi:hypothetical protein
LRKRQSSIGSEISAAETTLRAAERQANQLRGVPHPDLADAEGAAEAAAARHQELLEGYRREFLFPNDSDQGVLESVAATRIVDGLALLRLWQDGELEFGRKGLPDIGSEAHGALVARLDALADAVDAVRDTLLTESVYQLAQGRPARAGADLDAVAAGEMSPPELEVLRTPRSGAAVTHRVFGLVDPTGDSGAWPVEATEGSPRAAAEPGLTGWAGRLLGDPRRAPFRASYVDPDSGQVILTRDLHLGALPLSPLDLLYLAQTVQGDRYPDIEALIMQFLRRERPAEVPATAIVRLDLPRAEEAEPDALSLTELLDLANAAGRLVAGARALTDADLTRPDLSPTVTVDIEELRGRADRSESHFRELSGDFDAALGDGDEPAMDDLLFRATLFGIGLAMPEPSGVEGGPEDRARSVQRTIARRITELDRLAALVPGLGAAEARRDHELARMAAIFGDAFVVLPHLRPAHAAELAEAFAANLDAQGGDPFAATEWATDMARVRAPMDRLATTLGYAEALGGGAAPLEVAQLPHTPGQRWCALPPEEGGTSADGALSLVAIMPASAGLDSPVAGLWIDEWVEMIPAADVVTGVAFNFDEPASQAAQAILLAVHPDDSPRWDLDTLEAVVLETLDLARLRAVDPETLEQHTDLDQALPALYFAFNLEQDTVSTDFRRLVAGRQ